MIYGWKIKVCIETMLTVASRLFDGLVTSGTVIQDGSFVAIMTGHCLINGARLRSLGLILNSTETQN